MKKHRQLIALNLVLVLLLSLFPGVAFAAETEDTTAAEPVIQLEQSEPAAADAAEEEPLQPEDSAPGEEPLSAPASDAAEEAEPAVDPEASESVTDEMQGSLLLSEAGASDSPNYDEGELVICSEPPAGSVETTRTYPPTRVGIVEMMYDLSNGHISDYNTVFTDLGGLTQHQIDAVYWAVERGITNGVSQNQFAPNSAITRAHTVTFLYRFMNGQEDPDLTNPYVDVASDVYYYQPVVWSTTQDWLTFEGADSRLFSPNDSVERLRAVCYVDEQDESRVLGVSSVFVGGESRILLHSGETATFTKQANEEFPKIHLQVERAGAYTVRFTPPAGTDYTVGSGANIYVYGSDYSDRTDTKGVNIMMQEGSTYWLNLGVSGGIANGAAGEWTVTLEPAETTAIVLDETFTVPFRSQRGEVYDFYKLDAPETGSYLIQWGNDDSVRGRAYVCADTSFRSSVWFDSSYHSQVAYAQAGDQIILKVMSRNTRPASLKVSRVETSGTFGAEGNNLTWDIDEYHNLHITGSGSMGSLQNGAPWTDLMPFVQRVVVENGVTDVGDYAFIGAPALNYAELARTVTRIGDYAFSNGSAYLSLSFPDSLTEIGEGAFLDTNGLSTNALPDGLVKIGARAFKNTSINSFRIPASVTEIGYGALASRYLERVTVDDANKSFKVEDGVLMSKSGMSLLCYPAQKPGPYAVPDKVLHVRPDAFTNAKHLSQIFVPATLKSFGSFDSMPLAEISFGGTAAQWKKVVAASTADFTGVSVVFNATSAGTKLPIEVSGNGSATEPVEFTPESASVYSVTPITPDGDAHWICVSSDASGADLSLYVSDAARLRNVNGYGQNQTNEDYSWEGWSVLPAVYYLNAAQSYNMSIAFDEISSSYNGTWNLAVQKLPTAVLSLGENTISNPVPGRDTFNVFTAEEDGWYSFTAAGEGRVRFWNLSNDGYRSYLDGYEDPYWKLNAGDSMVFSLWNRANPCEATLTIEKIEPYGTCGDHATWSLDDNGVLTISGTGDMADYSEQQAPWYAFNADIRTLVVEEGITGLGNGAFSSCYRLTTVSLPASLERIAPVAFGWAPIATITLAAGNKHFVMDGGMLYDSAHQTLYRCTGQHASDVVVPDGVEYIAPYAFFNSSLIQSLSLPHSLRNVDRSAFWDAGISQIIYDGSAVEWYRVANGEGMWNNTRYLRASEAPAASLGSHTETLAPGDCTVYGFTAPETGLYRLTSANADADLFDGDGRYINRFYSGENMILIRLEKGKPCYFGFRYYGEKATTISWSLSKADAPALTLGDHTSDYNGEALAFTFTPAETGRYRFAFENYGSVAVRDSSFASLAEEYYTSRLAAELTAGETYYVLIYPNDGSSSFKWSVSMAPELKPIDIQLGENSLYVEGEVRCPFTPTESGFYHFYGTTSGVDTFAALYDANGSWLTDNDDGAGNMQFDILWDMTAGETYYLGVRYLNSGDGTLSFVAEKAKPAEYEIYEGENSLNISPLGAVLTFVAPRDGWYSILENDLNDGTCHLADAQGNALDLKKAQWMRAGDTVTLAINEEIPYFYPLVAFASARSGEFSEGLRWSVSDDSVLTITGTGVMNGAYMNMGYSGEPWGVFAEEVREIRIESGIRNIGTYAFAGCHSVESVSISDTVSEIDPYAFYECSSLTQAELPDSVTFIAYSAFERCSSLGSVNIPEGVTNIAYDTFRECTSLRGIVIPDSVMNIESNAFYGCTAMTDVTIPALVTKISYYAFGYCPNLQHVTYGGSRAQWDRITFEEGNTSLWTAEVTCADRDALLIRTQPQNACGYPDETARFTVEAEGYGLTYQWQYRDADNDVWANSSFKTATATCKITAARDGRQYRCVITDADGRTVTSEAATIRALNFNGDCLILGENTLMVDGEVRCRFTPEKSGVYCFCGTTYGEDIYASLYDADGNLLDEDDDDIGGGQFYILWSMQAGETYYLGVRYNDWSSGFLSFEARLEQAAEVELVVGGNYFNLTPYGIRGILTAPQDGWYGLHGSYLNYEDGSCRLTDAQGNALDLKQAQWLNEGDTIYIDIDGTPNTHYYNYRLQVDYAAARSGDLGGNLHWSVSDDGILTITGEGDMSYPRACWDAFETEIREIRIESGVTSISDSAFSGCYYAADVSIPDTVTWIGDYAFSYCGRLQSVTIPESVTVICANAFRECTSLQSVVIPKNVNEIGGDAFFSCSSLTEFEVSAENEHFCSVDGVVFTRDMSALVLYPCGRAGDYTIPFGVTELAEESFAGSPYLTGLTIPSSVTHVGYYAVDVCPSLRYVVYQGSLEQWSRIWFEEGNWELRNANVSYADHDGLLIRTQPQDAFGIVGDTARFTVEAEGTGLTYRWQYKDVGGAWANSSFKTATITCKLTEARDGRQYRCTVSDADNNSLTTDAAMIHVIRFDGEALELGERDYYSTQYVFTAPEAGSYRIYSPGFSYEGVEPALFREDGTRCEMENGRYYVELAQGERAALYVKILPESEEIWISVKNMPRPQPVTLQPGVNDVWVDGELLCPFTPAVSGEYTFRSLYNPDDSYYDTYVTLYDINGDYLAHDDDGGDNNQFVLTYTMEAGKTYLLGVRYYNRNNAGLIRVQISSPLGITQQPQSVMGKVGETATFTVTAVGDGLTYQWQYRDTGGSEWLNSSFKTATATCKITAARDGREYRCIVTDAYGSHVISEPAAITVGTPLAITQQPQDFAGKPGVTATFSVEAAGDGLTYQWQYKDPGKDWAKSSFKTPSLTCKITAARDGRQYRCIITDVRGDSVTSEPAAITVLTPLAITQQPQNFTGKVGDTATFTVAATGDGLTYQWEYKDVGGAWTRSSFKTATITCRLTAARDGRQYRCIITDAYGDTVTSEAAAIAVRASVLAITAQPQDFTGAVGETATFSVTATGEGLTYQWEYKDVGGAWAKSSFKTPSLTCKITAARDGRQYRCIITDAYGDTVTSAVAAIHVAAGPVITQQPQDFTGKVGETATFSVTATGEGLTYQWEYRDVGGTWAKSSFKTATMTCKLTAARDGRQYRCIVTDESGISVTSSAATIHVTA